MNAGQNFDPFTGGVQLIDLSPGIPGFLSVGGPNPTAITESDSTRTLSIDLLTGSSASLIETTGLLDFTFNPNPSTGTASINYDLNSTLTVTAPFFSFIYDLTTNPLTMSVSFDSGTATDYNLVTGDDVVVFFTVPSTITTNINIAFSGFVGQNNLSIQSPITVEVPEPTTIAGLFFLAALLFFAYKRRRHQQQALQAAYSFSAKFA